MNSRFTKRVDDQVLPDLTEADLESSASSWASQATAQSDRQTDERRRRTGSLSCKDRPEPRDAAERRQFTVMFCDLVGSTALAARLDPEDMPRSSPPIISAAHG